MVSTKIQKIIAYCPLLTSLDLINTTLDYVDLLEILPYLSKLESLSVSLVFSGPALFPRFSLSRSIKKLYVETLPDCILLAGVIGMMNKFEVLESAHVHLVGKTADPTFYEIPEVSVSRWDTLRTFVATRHWSVTRAPLFHYFLHRVFHNKLSREIQQWIERDKECYIYEHGYLNNGAVREVVQHENIRILRDYQVIDLTRGLDKHGAVTSRWGNPRSLRITDNKLLLRNLKSVNILGLCTTSLVELDLSRCHGRFSAGFWVALAEASPSLENLATPLCLFLRLDPENDDSWPREIEWIDYSLRKLPLKKLLVRGYEHHMSPFYTSVCDRCETRLTWSNFPQLRDLRCLEELTFIDFAFDPSAVDKMANPRIRTLRLNLLSTKRLDGMRELVQACSNVRNFQLMGINATLHDSELWNVIVFGRKFKRLCLGTRTWTPLIALPGFDPPTTAHSIHCHVPYVARVHGSYPIELEFTRNSRNLFVPKRSWCALGSRMRGLCCSESFIGTVKPLRWDTSEY